MKKFLTAIALLAVGSCGTESALAFQDQQPHAWQGVYKSEAVHRMRLGGTSVSTINPGIPAAGSPISSAPIRANFQSAYNDVNTIYGKLGAFGTMSMQNADMVAITSGNIDGTVIGLNQPAQAYLSGLNIPQDSNFGVAFFDGDGNLETDSLLQYETNDGLLLYAPNTGSSAWSLQVGNAFTEEDFEASEGSGAYITLSSYGGNNSNSGGSYFVLEDSNGSSDGSLNAIDFYTDGGSPPSSSYLNSGDVLGEFLWGSVKNDSVAALLQVTANGTQSGSSAPTKACLYTAATSTTSNTNNPAICLDSAYHIGLSSTSTPSATSCGTGSPSVSGNDQKGIITTATAATACTLNFAKAYPHAPTCVASSSAGFVTIPSPPSVSAVTFDVSTALTTGDIYYLCF